MDQLDLARVFYDELDHLPVSATSVALVAALSDRDHSGKATVHAEDLAMAVRVLHAVDAILTCQSNGAGM